MLKTHKICIFGSWYKNSYHSFIQTGGQILMRSRMGLLHSIWGNNTVLSTIMIWLNTAVYSDFVAVTCVTIGIPSRHMSAHMAMVNLALWGRNTSDQLSTIPVTNDSTMQNSLSIPRIWKHHIIFHSLTFQILFRLRHQFSKSQLLSGLYWYDLKRWVWSVIPS